MIFFIAHLACIYILHAYRMHITRTPSTRKSRLLESSSPQCTCRRQTTGSPLSSDNTYNVIAGSQHYYNLLHISRSLHMSPYQSLLSQFSTCCRYSCPKHTKVNMQKTCTHIMVARSSFFLYSTRVILHVT